MSYPPRRNQSLLASLFSGPNLPFSLAIIVSVLFLAGFLYLQGGDSGSSGIAGTTSTTAATSGTTTGDTSGTTADGSTSTSAGSSDTTATTAATSGTTATTVPGATTPTAQPSGPLQSLALDQVASGLPQPTFAGSPTGSDLIFVTERQGRVMIVDEDGVRGTPFLDLLDVVGSGGIENGLLGLAFHPDYATNGKVYVYFTDRELDSRVVEYTTSGLDATQVDRSTARQIFEIDQPPDSIRHRAGMLHFGPDGYLYIAFGDGGLGGAEAQRLDDPHGSILRVDVDNGDPYTIPPSNPFANGGGDPRIFAWGLRNPWRMSIDPVTNILYIGDVGQETYEEINAVPISEPGHDFGWPKVEAKTGYLGGATGDETPPITFYRHEDGACSISAGYAYRGTMIPELQGHFFYSDWCAGWIRSLLYDGTTVSDEQQWGGDLERVGQVTSFGLDGSGELLIVTSEGGIYRVVPVR